MLILLSVKKAKQNEIETKRKFEQALFWIQLYKVFNSMTAFSSTVNRSRNHLFSWKYKKSHEQKTRRKKEKTKQKVQKMRDGNEDARFLLLLRHQIQFMCSFSFFLCPVLPILTNL